MLAQFSVFDQAEMRPLKLGGVFQLGYSNSQAESRFGPGTLTQDHANELFWGLDFLARSYILDPRFINFSLEPSFLRSNGGENDTHTHRGLVGGNFSLEALPVTSYPFRFHFTDQNADYQQTHLTSSFAASRSIGFDWALRKPKFPRVLLSYDSSTFNYELSTVPTSLSHVKAFSILTNGNFHRWDSSFNFNRQSTTEAFTGVDTGNDMLRGDTRREFLSHSVLSMNGLFQELRFTTGLGTKNVLPFLNFNGNFNTRHTEKLSSNLYYRYSWLGNQQSGIAAPPPTQSNNSSPSAVLQNPSAFVHSAGGGVTYQPLNGLFLGESFDTTFTSTVDPSVEIPNRQIGEIGNVSFQRSIKFVRMRAGYQRGLTWALTNFGNSRAIWYDGYNAGFEIGDRRYLLAQAEYSVSNKPELFEIGGRYSEHRITGSLETQFLRNFNLRASAGSTRTDFLSSRGTERFHTATYSVSIENRKIALSASHNSSVGLQPLLFSPLAFDPTRIFRILPVETLINTPLSASYTVTSTASAEIRLFSSLNAQFRYVRERLSFPTLSSLLLNRYEASADYRLGKFVFTGGVLFNMDETPGASVRNRRYYFFKLSRSFKIF
jgi:hypothetical protein